MSDEDHAIVHMTKTDWKGGQDEFEPLPTYRDSAAKEAAQADAAAGIAAARKSGRALVDRIRSERFGPTLR